MDSKKDEALRAKAQAERKMLENDFAAARKMINKAQQLSLEVDNISQMLTVCDVHCAAGAKVNGEMDWYDILQVPVFTNDDTLIKKQYRKLALLLHPDKNKFAGAEEAFKLVGEANTTLTDNSNRSVYEMKRRASVRVGAARPSPYPDRPQAYWIYCQPCAMWYQYYT
jgi:preprotein translocase subunit Sec63